MKDSGEGVCAIAAAGLDRVEQYLSALPAGLDSFPEARAKGSLVRNALEGGPVEELVARLPPPLRRLASDLPMAGEWIPEVHFVALFLALTDVRSMTEAQIYAWTRERNRAMFSSATYRILMAVASPGALLRFAGLRWSNWHRGSRLDVDGIADEGVRFGLTFPAGLFGPVMLRVFAAAFAAALDVARAPAPEVLVVGEGNGFARYLARW